MAGTSLPFPSPAPWEPALTQGKGVFLALVKPLKGPLGTSQWLRISHALLLGRGLNSLEEIICEDFLLTMSVQG